MSRDAKAPQLVPPFWLLKLQTTSGAQRLLMLQLHSHAALLSSVIDGSVVTFGRMMKRVLSFSLRVHKRDGDAVYPGSSLFNGKCRCSKLRNFIYFPVIFFDKTQY